MAAIFSDVFVIICIFRDHIRTQETQRDKLLSLKETFEQKEIEFNKQSSELRVQVIELQESNVRIYLSVYHRFSSLTDLIC